MRTILEGTEKVKNIIFDLGNVVLDIDIQKSIDAFMDLHIGGLVADNIFPTPLPIFDLYERGALSSVEFLEKFRDAYPAAVSVSDEQFWAAWNVLFETFDPRRIALIKALSANYNLYLLSNTNEEHVRFFKKMYETQFGEPFESLFVVPFYSNELLCRKPEIEIYTKMIAQTGITPSESLFIDDLEKNVIGARECGLLVHHLTGGETILDLFK